MKKITFLLIIGFLSLIGNKVSGATTTMDGITVGQTDVRAAVSAATDGDVIVLTNSSGTYTWATLLNNYLKGITIKADPSLTTRPTITFSSTAGAFMKCMPTSLKTITLDGIDFNGAGIATGFITPAANTNGDVKIVINNCVLRNFTTTAQLFLYTAASPAGLAIYSPITITNSRLIGFGQICSSATATASSSNMTIRNCYLSTYANGINMINNSGGSSAQINIDHCTFNNCGTGTKKIFNMSSGMSSVIQNNIFVNCAQTTANTFPTATTGTGNVVYNCVGGGVTGFTISSTANPAVPTLPAVGSLTSPDVDYVATASSMGYQKAAALSQPSALSAFSYNEGAGPSAPQSFSVSGTDLYGNLVVSAPTNYEVSLLSGAGYASNLTFSPTLGVVAATTVYVRLIASLSANTYNGSITISSTNATSKTLSVAGSVATGGSPVISTSVSSLNSFNYLFANGPSNYQTFTVDGTNLSAAVSISGSTNYEVSSDHVTFGATASIGGAATLTAVPVYVRLKAGLSGGTYNTESLTLSSGSATPINVVCNGTVTPPTLTLTPTSLSSFFALAGSPSPSSEKSFTVSGSNVADNITITASTNYEISTGTGGSFTPTSPLTILQANAGSPTTIYVRLKGSLATASYTENITIATAGASNSTLACSGVVAAPIIKVGVSAGLDNKTVVTLAAYTFANGPSASLSGMLVSGDYLQSDVTATAPTNFEVSKDNSAFADFVTFTMSNQTVSGQLWVRLKAGLNSDTYSGNIVFSSTSAPNRNVTPTGSVTGGPRLTTGVLTGTSFSYAGNGPGVERTFTLSGTNMASDVTITASSNFEVSLTTGTGFSSTSITALQANVTAGTIIYVRLKAGAALGTYTEALSLSASNANTRSVSVTGTVSSLISLSSTSKSNVDYAGNGPSPEYSFTVSGTNMAGAITVTPPADYEVSTTSGSGYTLSPFTISPSSGVISQIIYFRLKAGLAPAAYSGEIISFAAATATTKNFACNGTVSPLLTTSVSTLTGFHSVMGAGASTEQSFTITGTNVSSDITLTPPANYEISTATGGSFVAQNPITILQANATTPTTIYVRLAAGLSVADYTGVNIVASATGAASKNVSVSGYVVAATAATDDYRSLASGNWTDNSSWESKAIGSTHWSAASLTPTSSATSVLILNGHTITLTSPLTIGVITINNGGTLAADATLTANGVVTINGVFQLNTGGWATGSGTWTYSGGTLAFNNISSYGVNSGDVFWPTTAGPTNINILQGGLTLNSGANKIVGGLFQTAAGVTLSGATLTLNGIAQINAGGYFANAPTYAVSSTLKYNTGGTYGRGTEWASPVNVELSNNTTLDYPNTGSGAFSTNLSIPGNLTVDAGSALYMDYGGSGNKSGSLSVSGNVILNGALSLGNALGGDLYVAGNWTTPATNSSFNSNSRAVIFNGSGSQVINHASTDAFPYLIINNYSNGVSIASNVTATNLTIKPKAKLTLDSGKTLTSTTFTIESDINGTGTYIDNGTSTITTATVQQYLASARNWYLSSPVSGASTSVGNTYWKYVENGNNGTTWTPVNTEVAYSNMVGYIALAPSANTLNFTGTLNNGQQSITGLTSSGTAKIGFNLVGNPYPSYVNWDDASNTKTNLGTTIWYRTKNNAPTPIYVFDTYNATAGIGTNQNGLGEVNGVIPPMQAFWVKVDATKTGTLTFTNAARSHADIASPNNKFRVQSAKNALQKVLRLQISNGTNSDETIVLFNSNALNELDDFDSPKMSNANVAIPEIYTTVGSDKLVINGMNNFSPDQKIALGFSTGQLNLFTIKAIQISNFDADTKIFIKDNLLNIEQELTLSSDYSFNSDVTSTDNRFSLIFKSASAITDLKNSTGSLEQDVVVSKNQKGQITVQYAGGFYGGASVSVYNASGQILIKHNLTSTLTEIDTPLSAGVYLVKVSNSVAHFTRKVTIN